MGRTIAYHFFHPYEVKDNKKKKDEILLKNWKDKNLPFYYGQIPIYLNKVYRSVDINLEKECCSIVPEQQCLPQIVVLDSYLEKVKEHIRQSKIYESVKYEKLKLNYNELPELMNLIKSSKYFMYYLHTPKKNDGIWFAEGRFFTNEEIEKTNDEKILKKINEFVKKKNINFMDFLEEWVGLIFHLIAEFLLFKQKVKIVFYSCDKCYRPGIFIKEKITKEEKIDINKIWGTVNIVDTIIYNCIEKNHFSKLCETKQRSINNIIYHDESFLKRYEEVSKDCEIFKNETDGAFILTTDEIIFDGLLKEIKSKSSDMNTNYKFDLIVTGSTAEKILKKINDLEADKYINRICIYSISIKKYIKLMDKYDKIEGIYNRVSQVINFINSNKEVSIIYPTIKLLTYKEYIDKNQIIHKLISQYYGNKDGYKSAISYLKDYLLWYPKLKVTQGELKKLKIETLIETLQKFQGINDNETNIIELYTKEEDSYYKDFNFWLSSSDPLAIQKTAWFIASVINNLNIFGQKHKKGLTKSHKLYRGVKSNLSDLLDYERAKGKLICFPSFTSTTILLEIAVNFSKTKNKEQYETIIIIDYIYKKDFIPTAIDVSEISAFPHEKEYLFPPYSFFKVKNTKIDHSSRTAEIELETVGRKKILEEYLKDASTLVYKEEGFMDLEPS